MRPFRLMKKEPRFIEGPCRSISNHDRWGMYVLDLLFQWGPSLPFFHILLAVIANLIAFVLAMHLWDSTAGKERYLAAVFALGYPMIAFVYEFNIVQYGYDTGLIFSVASVYVYIHTPEGFRRYLYTVLCMTLAVSVYQSLLFAAPVVYFLYLTNFHLRDQQNFHQKKSFRSAWLFAGCMILAVVLHGLIAGVIRKMNGIQDRYHAITNFYDGSFLATYDPIFVVREVAALLLGQRWYVGWVTGIVVILCFWIILTRLLQLPGYREKVRTLVFFSLAVLAPFTFINYNRKALASKDLYVVASVAGWDRLYSCPLCPG